MAGPAAVLREIHRLRRFAKDLQTSIEQGPRVLKAKQNALARQEEECRLAHEALKKLKVHVHEQETALKAKQEQVKKYERQLNTIQNKKEFDALKSEIETGKKECQQLEDAILEGLAAVEEKSGQLPLLDKGVQQSKAELAAFEREQQPKAASLGKERARILAELAEVEKTVPADVREQYERAVRGLGADALSAVEGNVCVACHTAITAQNLNDLRREVFLKCEGCGRMLYLVKK
jgi:uncharacterized protein